MAFQINRRAIAIDDSLGAKTWPQVQTALADQVVATYDVTTEFLENLRYGGNIYGGSNTGGTANRQSTTTNQLVVPAGERWFVESVSAYTPVGLGVGASATKTVLSVSRVGTGDLAVTGPATEYNVQGVAWSAGEVVIHGWEPHAWYGPSSTWGWSIYGAGLAALQVYFAWSGYRVRI